MKKKLARICHEVDERMNFSLRGEGVEDSRKCNALYCSCKTKTAANESSAGRYRSRPLNVDAVNFRIGELYRHRIVNSFAALLFARLHGSTKAARRFGVSVRTIRRGGCGGEKADSRPWSRAI